jgi:GT2 family glycosyltransferase
MSATDANDHIWYDADTPVVSIIIVSFKNIAELANCLASVWRHTAGYKYEIVVVDNGSGADEVDGITMLGERLRLIPLKENRFFGDGNNIGVEHAKGRYVVFLNNDCQVTPDWLPPLVAALEQQPLCGGAGPKLLYPDGRLQEAGAFMGSNGWALHRHYPPFDVELANRTHVVDYCSAACFITTRKLFAALGGFDPIFSPAYFEDADLAFRIADVGLFIYCCPQSIVYHHQNATTRIFWTEGQLQRLLHRNRDLFFDRWRHCLGARAKGSVLPQREFDARASFAILEAGLTEAALESETLKAAQNVARLERHVGYLSVVISSCAGELGVLRAERDKHAADAALDERIADIENQMQRELAAWRAAREQLRLITSHTQFGSEDR